MQVLQDLSNTGIVSDESVTRFLNKLGCWVMQVLQDLTNTGVLSDTRVTRSSIT